MPTTPTGLYRRELFVDARDLQSQSESGGEALTPEEYAGVLTTRGLEKLAENQLVRSFSAQVRTQDATYQYGRDFFLGDKITVTDERLGITVDARVMAAQYAIGSEGESLTLTLGYSQPTLYDKLARKADK